MHDTRYKISLDNITIVGEPARKCSEIRHKIISESFVGQFWQTPHKRYMDNFTLLAGGLLQITHDKGFINPQTKFTDHQIRLEFNPNKVILYPKLVPYYLDLIKLIKEPRVTRKDIAIDIFGENMNEWIINDLAARKSIEYKDGRKQLETLYLGSKYSDERIRIYNKKLEQGLGKEDIENWWRIEAQIRKEKAEMTKYNPFTKLKIVTNSHFEKYDLKTRAMLEYLQKNPSELINLGKATQTKYRKLLAEHVEYWYIDIDGMCAGALEEIQTEIESWLNFCPIEKDEVIRVKIMKSVLSDEMQKELEKPKELSDDQIDDMLTHLENWDKYIEGDNE